MPTNIEVTNGLDGGLVMHVYVRPYYLCLHATWPPISPESTPMHNTKMIRCNVWVSSLDEVRELTIYIQPHLN